MKHRILVALSDPFSLSHALVVAVVLATWLGFEYLGGRYLRGAGGGELLGDDPLIALEVVLITLAIAALYMHLQGRRWADYGLARPLPGWRIGIAVMVASGCAHGLAPRGVALGVFSPVLTVGEELLRRGFLLNEVAALLGGGRRGAITAVALLAALSTLGHLHAGVAVGLATGVVDLVLGSLYFISGRSLWSIVAARGFVEAAIVIPTG